MTLVLAVLTIAILVAGYFFLGFTLKFLWSWWPMLLGVPALIAIGLGFGLIGAAIAIVGLFALIGGNSNWQGTDLYVAVERRIDGMFFLSDT